MVYLLGKLGRWSLLIHLGPQRGCSGCAAPSSSSPSSSISGGRHCCLCVAPIQALKLAHRRSFSHFWWQRVPFFYDSQTKKVFSVLVVGPFGHQIVLHCIVSGWPPALGPLEPQVTVHHVHSHHNLVGLHHVDLVPPLLSWASPILQLILVGGGPDGGPQLDQLQTLNVCLGPWCPAQAATATSRCGLTYCFYKLRNTCLSL